MKPLFIKKNGTVSKVSGIVMNLIPSYTMAEYNALTHKPLLWIRTDEDYAQIPASDVSYGSGSVKDALDGLFKQFTFNNVTLQDTRNYYDLAISLTADEISKILFCNATVIASEVDIYQCYWRNTNTGVRVIGKAQVTATYSIIVTIVFRA